VARPDRPDLHLAELRGLQARRARVDVEPGLEGVPPVRGAELGADVIEHHGCQGRGAGDVGAEAVRGVQRSGRTRDLPAGQLGDLADHDARAPGGGPGDQVQRPADRRPGEQVHGVAAELFLVTGGRDGARRRELGDGLAEARPHGPRRKTTALQVRHHVGTGGHHDLVPGVAGGVHQREHREDVPHERAGGEEHSHDRQ
jgi:hypothetical protein